jgi:hypothetical protein
MDSVVASEAIDLGSTPGARTMGFDNSTGSATNGPVAEKFRLLHNPLQGHGRKFGVNQRQR